MSGIIAPLTKAFWEVCIFRRGPQDIPASGALFALSMLCYLGATTGINLKIFPPATAMLLAGTEIGTLSLITALLLSVLRYRPRIVQTITAILGCGTLISLPVFALFALGSPVGGELKAPELLARIMIFFWNVLLIAHIMRHALSTRFATGFAVAVIYVVIMGATISWIEIFARPPSL
ncbi:MAG: hypothetical protein AAF384_01750 [Pseudomonadota bacterium]